jgi:Brp/Blh family beta-carotene 15,15'-monooxygenase
VKFENTGPLMAVGLALLLGALDLGSAAQYGVLSAVIVLLVLPHGAVDILSLTAGTDAAPTTRRLLLYVAVATATLAAWFLWPALSLSFFFLLTALHFAQGDRWWFARREQRRASLRALPMGVLPVAAPAGLHPEPFAAALNACLGAVGASTTVSSAAFSQAGWVVGLVAILIGVVASDYRPRKAKRALRRDLLELCSLVLLFVVAPPAVAIALYLAFWHGWRHLARVAIERSGVATAATVTSAVRDSKWIVAASVLGFAIFASIGLVTGASAGAILGVLLAGLAAVTAPHVVVVTAMDLGMMRPAAR